VRPPDIEPRDPLPAPEEPREEPPPAAAPEAAAPSRPAAARDEAAPRDPAPARDDEAAPPATSRPAREAAATPAEAAASRPAAARDDGASRPAAARDDGASRPAAARDDGASRPAAADVVHQPTVEYTPFQTDEHTLPPRDDDEEPRLVAAGGVAAATFAEPEPEPEPEPDDEPEAAAPEPRPLRRAPERDGEPAPPRAAPNAPRRRPPKTPRSTPTGGGRHWGRRIFAGLALLLLLAVVYAANKTFQPFHGDPGQAVALDIPADSDAAAIGKLLEAKGVVDSARFFEVKATISGDRGDLRPGHYTLRENMSNGDAIAALTKVPDAPTAPKTVTLTLLEGPSRRENAPVVDDSKKVTGSYAKASASKATLKRIRALGAPKGTKTAEGFLFPATYTLPEGASANDLVTQQLDAFEDNFKQVDLKYAKSKHLTRYDVLIIASMIEREAQLAKERALVSAVIYNRLKEGMPLGIDATIRYSTDNWKRPIRQSELDRDEPYNTRIHRGLPPTPIGNPGLASLKAAAKPSKKSYLFYVRKPGSSGAHAFSSTDAQFERDVAKYQASRKDK